MESVKNVLKRLPMFAVVANRYKALRLVFDMWLDRQRLKRAIRSSSTIQLIIGAGGTRQEGWIPTEQSQLDLLRPVTWERFFSKSTVAAMNAEHVWEHLSPHDGVTAAQTCFQFLRPGGRLRCAVPDGFHPDEEYIEYVRPGGTGEGSDDHKVLYTIDTFTAMFKSVGFEVVPLEFFDSNGNFYAIDWNPADGYISRSLRYDDRNRDKAYGYTSIIVDAIKPIQ